jgi:hypothetical protein
MCYLRPILFDAKIDVSTSKMYLDISILASCNMYRREYTKIIVMWHKHNIHVCVNKFHTYKIICVFQKYIHVFMEN